MAQVKMTNEYALREQESTFRATKLDNGYSMTFQEAIINKNSENEADITALIYKRTGSANTFQRFNIFSFRRDVKFIDDNANNRKALKTVNKKVVKLIKEKGRDLTFGDFQECITTINSLTFVSPFKPVDGKEGFMAVPDEIEVLSVLPKFNVGMFDTPSNKCKLRYNTRSYVAKNYIQKDNGDFVTSDEGESLSYMARELGNDKKFDDIIDLYDAAEIDATAAKDIKNIIFNTAICVSK